MYISILLILLLEGISTEGMEFEQEEKPTLKVNADIDAARNSDNSTASPHAKFVPIQCSADGNPAPTFHWEKLSHDGKWSFAGNGPAILSINGIYRCAAKQNFSNDFVYSQNITIITIEHLGDVEVHNSAATIAVTILLLLAFIIMTIIGGCIFYKKCTCLFKTKQKEYELVTQFTDNKTILTIEKP